MNSKSAKTAPESLVSSLRLARALDEARARQGLQDTAHTPGALPSAQLPAGSQPPRSTSGGKRPAAARIADNALDVAGKIWTLPNTLAGLALGGAGTIVGLLGGTHPQVKFGHNAVEFLNNPLINDGEAISLGNAISYSKSAPPEKFGSYNDRNIQIGPHEEAHTYQAQLLGPFYAPAWILAGGRSGLSNPLEAAAQRYAAGSGSWWPW
jgi:hypothetical protein